MAHLDAQQTPKIFRGTWDEIASHRDEIPPGTIVELKVIEEPSETSVETANETQRDPALVARVKNARGKFAHVGAGLASEQLHRERQADKRKEEQRIERFQP